MDENIEKELKRKMFLGIIFIILCIIIAFMFKIRNSKNFFQDPNSITKNYLNFPNGQTKDKSFIITDNGLFTL